MKKKIVHRSFKLTPHHTKINLPIAIASVFALCFLVGGYLFSTMQKSSINMIAPPSMPRSNPELTAPTDCAVVNSFTLSNTCGNNSFTSMTYSCGKNGAIKTQGGSSSCKPYTMWYEYAATDCRNSCPKVSTSAAPTNCTYQQVKCVKAPCPKILVCPSPSPTPMPSLKPSPTPIIIGGPTSRPYPSATSKTVPTAMPSPIAIPYQTP